MSDSLRDNAIEWWSAGRENTWSKNREAFVRVWTPGDGLTCFASGYQRRNSCLAPVAVVKEVLIRNDGYRERATVSRVVCIRHLAQKFGADPAPVQEQAVNQAALEELAQRHWTEYSDILSEARTRLMQERLAVLPEDLRDRVIEVMTAMSDEERADGQAVER